MLVSEKGLDGQHRCRCATRRCRGVRRPLSPGYICEITGGFPYVTEEELIRYNAALADGVARLSLPDARQQGICPELDANGVPKVRRLARAPPD